jgi:hypothetical protein
MSSKVQGFKKIQIVHAYLESGRNPLIKVLVMFFSAFVLRILSFCIIKLQTQRSAKKNSFLKQGKNGYKKMLNFMRISVLKKCFRNTAPKMFYPKRSCFFFLGTIFWGKAVFQKYRFGALFLKHSFRPDTHVDLC